MNEEYRTEEQYQTMVENMINGNWTDAAQNAVDFGWYASDIRNFLDQNGEEVIQPDNIYDFAYVVEHAQKIRDGKE